MGAEYSVSDLQSVNFVLISQLTTVRIFFCAVLYMLCSDCENKMRRGRRLYCEACGTHTQGVLPALTVWLAWWCLWFAIGEMTGQSRPDPELQSLLKML